MQVPTAANEGAGTDNQMAATKEKKLKHWEVWSWDICIYLHAMSDFGRDPEGGFSRPHTNNAECYAAQEGIKCPRRGRCLIAKVRVTEYEEE